MVLGEPAGGSSWAAYMTVFNLTDMVSVVKIKFIKDDAIILLISPSHRAANILLI